MIASYAIVYLCYGRRIWAVQSKAFTCEECPQWVHQSPSVHTPGSKRSLVGLGNCGFREKNEEGVSNNVSKVNDVLDECVSWRKA
jgi:transcription elongation factor Elf1